VVFPHAECKFFLTASQEERVRRRYEELQPRDPGVTAREVAEEIARRDARDEGRAVAPLKPAPEAVIVDTTGRGPEEVLADLLAQVRTRLG
jgi:cytidylate kinase